MRHGQKVLELASELLIDMWLVVSRETGVQGHHPPPWINTQDTLKRQTLQAQTFQTSS
jgi:hypothetical protein